MQSHPRELAGVMQRAGLMLALIVALQGCGFELRGSQSINAAHIASLDLRTTTATDLTREVRAQLQLAGVAIASDAGFILSIDNEHYDRAVLSVSPRTGKAEEFLLTLNARMSLVKADGTSLIQNEPISASHDYLFDEDALLGKAAEEDVLKTNLRQQAAANIIRRVRAATNAH